MLGTPDYPLAGCEHSTVRHMGGLGQCIVYSQGYENTEKLLQWSGGLVVAYRPKQVISFRPFNINNLHFQKNLDKFKELDSR